MNYNEILERQREFFATHKTKNLKYRKEQLEKLKRIIQNNENLLYEAIYKDFGKSKADAFTTEISFVLNDIDYYLKNLNSLARPKRVKTNLLNQPGTSKIYPEPLGNTLIIGAWNYPYQLTLSPAVAAIAAGNTVMAKPSEIAANTMQVMAKIINENFNPDVFYCMEGGIEETTEILKEKFDKIFFTGSTRVGKIIYEAAAKHLTPVTLELGGKSPAIVTKNSDYKIAAKRIVWGKFLNAGQTCVAADYVLVDQSIEEKFLEYLKEYIVEFNYREGSEHYTRIINQRNFSRLTNLIHKEKIYLGGNYSEQNLHIEPTVLRGVDWDDAVMQEEIFGPVLPVLTYDVLNEALNEITAHEKPLAAYIFTNDHGEKKLFTDKISFGGGCINDVVMHLSNESLPFGGVGNSGIGSYHGKYGFETFSHQKAVLERATWGEPNLKYPPYTENKMKWIKRVL
ncbi:aldehyde dehydrogenase [Chryseobacterium taklimakanense]|uniref:Aldehyde dehydrogenase n=1 Tax=Chryseobacterium taklimakanense TaxID=536441 RepID=A0A3G8WPQ6_9FLAO|nr:aldehyde dehydrogenase [Chryseobacterium taklimakanense]AZI20164.1 aldehyde dehydrogenase [Chryseobacterium taklimakanense]